MPGLDGTGPRGMGPMTGGGRGWCNPLWAGYGASGGFGYPYYGGYPGWQRWGYGMGYPSYNPIYSYGYMPRYPYTPSPWGSPYGSSTTPGAYGMGYPIYSPMYSYGNTPGYPYAPSPWGSLYGSPMAPEGEKEWLKGQADLIQQQIDQINSRIMELGKE
jgi:hypothetical protein